MQRATTLKMLQYHMLMKDMLLKCIYAGGLQAGTGHTGPYPVQGEQPDPWGSAAALN